MSETSTISCEEALRLLFEFLDGELERDQHETVDSHLRRCRSCFSRVEFERRLKSHLTAMGKEPVQPAFEERIRSLIGQFTCL